MKTKNCSENITEAEMSNNEITDLIRRKVCSEYCRLDSGRCIILQRYRENRMDDILCSDEYGWTCLMLGRFGEELRKPKRGLHR